jgi:hypothetical protein
MLLDLAFAALVLAQEPDRIDELVRKLGAEDFAEREKAGEELRRLGKPAEEALRKAAESEDPEVRRRARGLLDELAGKPPAPPKRGPRPGPPPGFQGFRGSSVQVRTVNGDSTYILTPGDGAPALTFHKKREGAVKLEVADEKGKPLTAEAGSIAAFLKDHKELAERFGITEEGIDYAGARVGFKGGILERMPPRPPFPFEPRRGPRPEPPPGPDERPLPTGPDFEPASEALRAQLGLAEGQGVTVLREGALPGLKRFDVVVELDGEPVGDPGNLRRRAKPGSVFKVVRKGERLAVGGDRKDF